MIKMIENVINESQVRHTNSVELVLVVFVGKQCSLLGIMTPASKMTNHVSAISLVNVLDI
jgi:hypothetical protein